MAVGSADALGGVVVAAIVGILVAERRALATVWFRVEDGRTLAALRIVTGVLLISYVAARAPLEHWLSTDEGLFSTEVAQQVYGAHRFAGYGGSLLLFRSDPATVFAHQVAFYLACGAFTLGFFTRVTKWVTWFLWLSILYRSHIVAGGEQVFTCWLVLLCWSRCGAAWSLDRVLDRGRTPPQLVPAWPRWLMILQTVPLWTVNGLHKHGRDWAGGDALWYVLHNAKLRRGWVDGLADAIGPLPLRLATWFVHAFEVLFVLVVIGAAIAALRGAPRPGPRCRIVAGVGWLTLAAAMIALAWAAFPQDTRGRWPFVAIHLYAAAIVVAVVARPTVPARVRQWAFGRRVWLVAALVFSAGLVLLLDIGPFPAMAGATCLVFFRGEELGRVVERVAARAGVRLQSRPAPIAVPPPGRARRAAIAILCAAHVLALLLANLPRDESRHPWRKAADAASSAWIRAWGTWQSWSMFAPRASHSTLDMQVTVTLVGGETREVGWGIDADPAFDPGSAYFKARKAMSRLVGRSSTAWYRKWHARYVCRAWAMRHRGRMPQSVKLWRTVTPILPPGRDATREAPPPRAEVVHEEICASTPHGRPSPEILRRHGITG